MEHIDGKTNSEPGILSLIFDIVKRQISISADFLILLESEKQALIEMNMSAIIALTQHKENELAKMAQLDHSLQEVARQICDNNSIDDRIVNLVELIPFINKEQTVKMKKYRDQLADLREKIIDNNLINKRFAGDTLGYINDAISLICSDISSDRLYSTHGLQQAMSAAPALVSREV